ncbi:MAG: hypothetical protein AAF311_10010 [Pseudomonadota bacterium]
MDNDIPNTTMAALAGLSEEEILAYIENSARELSEMALTVGKAEASALLAVVAGNLKRGNAA